jgi:hypothetical protein
LVHGGKSPETTARNVTAEKKEAGMDAVRRGNRQILIAAAVVVGLVCSAAAARAEVLVHTRMAAAPQRSQVQVIERATAGEWCGAYSSYERRPSCGHAVHDHAPAISDAVRACILTATLLIPPPVDLVTGIPTSQPNSPHPVVTGGPGLQNNPVPGGDNSQVLHTQSAPEPASFLLAAVGGGLAAASAWYRRRRSRRRAQDLQTAVAV